MDTHRLRPVVPHRPAPPEGTGDVTQDTFAKAVDVRGCGQPPTRRPPAGYAPPPGALAPPGPGQARVGSGARDRDGQGRVRRGRRNPGAPGTAQALASLASRSISAVSALLCFGLHFSAPCAA